MADFQNKYGPWAVITGADSEFGKAVAYRLASRGLDLILVGIEQTEIQELAQHVSEHYGVQSSVIVMDLSRDGAVQQIAGQTVMMNVGLLVHNASAYNDGPFLDMREADLARMLDLNIRSAIKLMFIFGNRFRARNGGGIILMGSMTAYQGVPFAGLYSGGHALTLNMGEALFHELAKYHVDILTVAKFPSQLLPPGTPWAEAKYVGSSHGMALLALDSLGVVPVLAPTRWLLFLGWIIKSALPRRLSVLVWAKLVEGKLSRQPIPSALLRDNSWTKKAK